MENMKQVIFKKNGSTEWTEMGPTRTLKQFNSDFHDWVLEYGFDGEQILCENWEEALEVLNTVGASALAGRFDLLPAVVNKEQESLIGFPAYSKCALYNELGGYEGIFTLFEFAEYMDDDAVDFKDWTNAEKYAKEEGYTLVKVL